MNVALVALTTREVVHLRPDQKYNFANRVRLVGDPSFYYAFAREQTLVSPSGQVA